MALRWMLPTVAVLAVFVGGGAGKPALAAPSLAERFGSLLGSGEEPTEATEAPLAKPAPVVRRDNNVRPAAAAAREVNQGNTARRATGGGGRSLFGGLRLPGFLGSSHGGDAAQDASGPPMPYGPEDGAAQVQRQRATTPATGAAPRRQAGAAAGTAQRRPTVGATAPSSPPATQPATPRVVRSSPQAGGATRHNELAEALTGLRARTETTESSELAVEPSDVAPPSAVAEEETPSYLRTTTTAAAPAVEAASPRATVRGPLDVADALSGGIPSAAAPRATAPRATATRARTTAAAPTARPQATAPRPQATTARAAAPRPTVRRSPAAAPAAETDIAAALRGGVEARTPVAAPETTIADEAHLGGIVAESAPYEFTPSPAPVTSSVPVASRPRAATSAVPTVPNVVRQSKPIPATSPSPAQSIGNVQRRTNLLLNGTQPLLVSSVAGPQRIAVGREAEYRVSLENQGDAAARDVVATIAVPSWAEVVDAVGSNGSVDRTASAAEGESNSVRWQLYELAAGASQTLTLKLVPRSGRPLQLGVQWGHAPVSSEATVEVEEPKLQMEISGPSEVMFGKSQRYTLTLSNPGTGEAGDVVIELVPPGGDPKAPVKHKVGTLAAGATKSIELELTAREAGDLRMLASAIGAGDLRTETVKTVVCRKAELEIDWRGPEKNFAGAVATYYLRVRNPGTAPAEQVTVAMDLPAGAELVDASAGNSWDAEGRVLSWKPGSLAAGEERFLQVRCRLTQAGMNQMELVAQTASGDLSDVASVPVTIEALADLSLVVTDPQGVIPVGDGAVYEIKVTNRGQIAATGVNVIAMFSAGIEPVQVEGGQHEIRDGRVAFRTIDSLPAGAETVLRIHAKATSAGTHVFRAEVVCDDLETKLASEETTRFFVEEDRWADASAAYSEAGEATTR
jgi:uncharacterized repeat protein (TIGR01451 family)